MLRCFAGKISFVTRRELLAALAAYPLVAAENSEAPFDRIDTHIHLNRPGPAIVNGFKETRWRALTICDSRATANNDPPDLPDQIKGAIELHRESSGLIAWATSFDARQFERADFAEVATGGLNKSFRQGAIAVKIWKNVGMGIRSKSGAYLMPDNPALFPIYEAIQKQDKTLVAHLAEPDGAWLPLNSKNPELAYYSAHREWYQYGRPGAPSKEAILLARDRVLARFPKLRVVGAHLGSNESDLHALGKRLDTHPNFAVDMAARVRYLAAGNRSNVQEFLNRYQDRITYGTDFVWRAQSEQQAWHSVETAHDRDWIFFSGSGAMNYGRHATQGLALPESILRKIFYVNPARWFPGIV
jgi:predicted TIM-barrel fold metal-dependent hydrolase